MDDMSKFKDEFILESREHLEGLNSALLNLEKNPGDEKTLNDIFRFAHTIKGNGNTMGFKKLGELAHSMEDLFDDIKNKRLKSTSSLMDTLFGACDLIEDGLDIIDKEGNDNHLDTSLILKKIMHFKSPNVNQNEDHHADEYLTLEDSDWEKINIATAENKKVFRVVGAFKPACKIKFAKALILLRELSSISKILKSNPSEDDIKVGKLGLSVEFVIITEMVEKEITTKFKALSGFDHIDLMNIDTSYSNKKLSGIQKENLEIAKKEILEKNKSDVTKQVQTVKINIKRLDNLMNLIGEIMITNMMVQEVISKIDVKELSEPFGRLGRLITEVQGEVMSQRMIPIGTIFNRYQRMVRDLSKKEGKRIELIVKGEEIEFDRTILDEIGDPLVHLLRNCVDHGIEPAEERKRNGKDETGHIYLIASRKKDSAIIEVRDDGVGIDPEKVKRTAIKKGLISMEKADTMTPAQLKKLIFLPGLSTNEVVTTISGRGVGMDVVEHKIKNLGGKIHFDSQLGKGTKVLMELPLTLAIVSALIVKIEKETYAIQLSQVDRVVKVSKKDIKTIQGNESFVLDNKDIPLLRLSKELDCTITSDYDTYTTVICENENSHIGLIVDSIVSQQQILIKPLADIIKGSHGITGAMILGGGEIGLILDVAAFA